MMRHFQFLSSTPVLWGLFVASLVLAACFPLAASSWQLTFIDGISSPEQTREVIAGFSAEQRTIHAWLTATLDVLFPLAYGGFFTGCALRLFPTLGWLALPGLLVIPVDLVEGVVQVLALTGGADWLGLKAFVTPLKMWLFWAGAAIALVGGLRWLFRAITQRKT